MPYILESQMFAFWKYYSLNRVASMLSKYQTYRKYMLYFEKSHLGFIKCQQINKSLSA